MKSANKNTWKSLNKEDKKCEKGKKISENRWEINK
jgi:hypothetical protein